MNALERTKGLIDRILAFIETSPWAEIYSPGIKMLAERLDRPCELAIIGRVKAGKSSFINALLGEDKAMVGTTETTATINFFKYGRPEDESKAVKVVWNDGRISWESSQFLDSLQGNDAETLKKSADIDHLEYFLPNQILSDITLVDTPGTGALVSEHERATSDYLGSDWEKLRKKHDEQSVELKAKADAVIVITGRVPAAETNKIVANFSNDTSSFNALGVMTKIDLEKETTSADWERRCEKYSDMLRNQLYMILPVSAGVFRAVEKLKANGRLANIRNGIRMIPASDFDEVFDELSTNFLSNEGEYDELYNSYGMPFEMRRDLVGDLEWMVFHRIAKELYRHDLDTAVANLTEYSGMGRLRQVLDQQFFNRSKIIRCAKITSELKSMLTEINIKRLYGLRHNIANRDDFLKIIRDSKADAQTKKEFEEFVTGNIISTDDYRKYEKRLGDLISETEHLQSEFSKTDKKAEGLLLLEKLENAFSEKEYTELESLLGRKGDSADDGTRTEIGRRQAYWRGRRRMVFNPEICRLLDIVIKAYENKLSKV